MTLNQGKPPKTDKDLRIMWSIGPREWSRPYSKAAWMMMDWRLGRSCDIVAVEFADK